MKFFDVPALDNPTSPQPSPPNGRRGSRPQMCERFLPTDGPPYRLSQSSISRRAIESRRGMRKLSSS
jgi:hypothetical protein